jgi:hypothetical protein
VSDAFTVYDKTHKPWETRGHAVRQCADTCTVKRVQAEQERNLLLLPPSVRVNLPMNATHMSDLTEADGCMCVAFFARNSAGEELLAQ